jgi:hypothetical protein
VGVGGCGGLEGGGRMDTRVGGCVGVCVGWRVGGGWIPQSRGAEGVPETTAEWLGVHMVWPAADVGTSSREGMTVWR